MISSPKTASFAKYCAKVPGALIVNKSFMFFNSLFYVFRSLGNCILFCTLHSLCTNGSGSNDVGVLLLVHVYVIGVATDGERSAVDRFVESVNGTVAVWL